MAKYKYVMESICEYEYKYAERHLEEMAEKGWMLENTGFLFWKYRKIEPERKKFSVTYIPGLSRLDPETTEEEEILKEYCGQTGWYKVANWGIMKIFANDDADAVPIDTDEKLRFEAYKESKDKSFLLDALISGSRFVIFAFIAAIFGIILFADPLMILGNLTMLLCVILIFLLAIVMASYTLSYWTWLERSEEQIEQGGTCAETRGPGIVRKAGIVLLAAFGAIFLLSHVSGGAAGTTLAVVLHIVGFMAVAFVAYKIGEFARKKGVPKQINIVLALVVAVGLVSVWRPYQDQMWTMMYEYNETDSVGTPWLSNEYGEMEVEGKQVEYDLYEVRSEKIWDFCVEKCLTGSDGVYEETDAEVWGCDKAYTFIPTEYEEGEVTFIGEPDPEYFIEYAGEYLFLKDNYIIIVKLTEDIENKGTVVDAVLS